MKARAVAKYIKGSPQKARLVIDLIRGRNVTEALGVLKTSNKRAAGPIEITLRSAIANAEQKADQLNVAIDVDRLKVSSAMVDLGPTKYRRCVRPAPMGRAFRERRWVSHITIEVESEKES
jgi:large subunit ribosomal protein L22